MSVEIYLIDLSERGLFLLNKSGKFVFPGGKLDENYSHYDNLYNLCLKDLDIDRSQISIYNYYRTFKDRFFCSADNREFLLYFGSISGWIKPSKNIDGFLYKNEFDFDKDIFMFNALSFLKKDHYIK